ncbi:MAG: hypothetical protein JNK48_24450 [Bryobacterales bacterium]|nr:hypothetical protein [Bryobacterales bacterium]
MHRLVLLLALAAAALAQDSPVTTRVAPLGIPCEPGQALPIGAGFPIVCPPAAEQGFMVFVKTTDDATAGYKVKLRYTTAEGEAKEAEQSIARNKNGAWTVAVFQVGRMKTDALSGNTASGVDVEQLATFSTASTAKSKSKN